LNQTNKEYVCPSNIHVMKWKTWWWYFLQREIIYNLWQFWNVSKFQTQSPRFTQFHGGFHSLALSRTRGKLTPNNPVKSQLMICYTEALIA